MRIWIDLGNSPHVPLFDAIGGELVRRDHTILWTARDFAQTVEMTKSSGINATVIGAHGGRSVFGKGLAYWKRVYGLYRHVRNEDVDLYISHNSHEPLPVTKWLGITSVNMMDYEHHPANRLSFRLADRNLVPESFPDEVLKGFGADHKTHKYDGIKEDIYLCGYETNSSIEVELSALGISPNDVLVVMRPRADDALYNRGFENRLFDKFISNSLSEPEVKLLILPRTESQRAEIEARFQSDQIVFPTKVLDGAAILSKADLVVSGGGTMNREAAALGTPVLSIFTGKTAAVDQYLASTGAMKIVSSSSELDNFQIVRKPKNRPRNNPEALNRIVDLILSFASDG